MVAKVDPKDKKMSRAQVAYEYESALCHELMFSSRGDMEEYLVGVLGVLKKVAKAAGLENVELSAEQAIISLTAETVA